MNSAKNNKPTQFLVSRNWQGTKSTNSTSTHFSNRNIKPKRRKIMKRQTSLVRQGLAKNAAPAEPIHAGQKQRATSPSPRGSLMLTMLLLVALALHSSACNRAEKTSHEKSPILVGAPSTMSAEALPGLGAGGIGYSDPTLARSAKAHADETARQLNTDEYERLYENDFLSAKDNPLSTFSIDVDKASYSIVRRFLHNSQMPYQDAVRIEELVNYFTYDYPKPTDTHPFSIYTELADCPWNSAHKLLHIGLQGKTVPMQNLPPSNLVFLIDVSGSMEGPDRLDLVKASFALLTKQLRAIDRVAIVVYAGNAGLVLPSTSGAEKKKILDALERLEAGGSTAGGQGIELAYKVAKENFVKGGNNRVILATDGDFNVGVSSTSELIRMVEEKRNEGIFLTVLGFGMGNYKDERMEQLADKGNGNYAYIDNLMEGKKVFVSEFGGTLFTIAKDVKIQVEFNPAKVKSYRLIGYENRMLKKEDFNDDKKDAGEIGSGHSVTAIYEVELGDGRHGDGKTDKLKYQTSEVASSATQSNELCTIKLRYKAPDGEVSKLIERTVPAQPVALEKASPTFRFAAAVAEFGLLLRNSEHKGKANYQQVLELADGAKGNDEEGYRAEFIGLVKQAKLISEQLEERSASDKTDDQHTHKP
jgi:Ca-activated chloride channel family protein